MVLLSLFCGLLIATQGSTELTRCCAAVADASAYICSPDVGESEATAQAVATATASVFAEAVAHGSIECTIQGEGSAKVNLKSFASSRATAWLNAYASSVANSEVCGKCSNVAKGYAEVVEEVSLDVLADVTLSVDSTSTDADGCALILLVQFSVCVRQPFVLFPNFRFAYLSEAMHAVLKQCVLGLQWR